ncbi:MAG TPA: hypothetical protein VKJ00_02970 [Thermoanaerobaculia bacterium]|nr:hypothetical protein [Thermoanaerobaculia bacterium]
MKNVKNGRDPVRIEARSVFEVNNSRLGIGVFNRPLLDTECRKFRKAWEMEPLPGFQEYELDRGRISFVAPAENVPVAWKSIDRLLAFATEDVKKAS